MADTGGGATYTNSAIGTLAAVAIRLTTQQGGTVDVTALSDAGGFAQKIPMDITEPGGFEIDFLVDPTDADTDVPVNGAAGSSVVTWPIHTSGNTTNATLTGTGIVTSLKFPDFANNEPQIGTVVVEFDGGTGPAFVPETA